jgi:hypothetical protein
MTLFFIKKQFVPGLGKRFDAKPMMAVGMADVIVIVDKDDRWLITKDRHDVHGQYLHPQRRAELLANYHVLARPSAWWENVKN